MSKGTSILSIAPQSSLYIFKKLKRLNVLYVSITQISCLCAKLYEGAKHFLRKLLIAWVSKRRLLNNGFLEVSIVF